MPVRVSWLREERGPDGEYVEAARGHPVAGVWREMGSVHVLHYEEQVVEGDGAQSVRTVLRLEPLRAALVRYGDVAWQHTFEAGKQHASLMRVGPLTLRTAIATKRLEMHVTPRGGRVEVEYDLALGESREPEDAVHQSVRVTVWFTVEERETAQPGASGPG
ncbi:hypothetical protein GCM10010885_10060 [Alicyclobacillus cellulosilyticus]|uniref:DUF1934 domain-containing protein n=2 Tax=Alicyclobacillus cellulosilyticus TaxID=1003997 RepID=A0A917K8Y3_9BACL|nr:hypothetical protein GCM10010885_10060 [Alicyclobacillus cellulosilyticus]